MGYVNFLEGKGYLNVALAGRLPFRDEFPWTPLPGRSLFLPSLDVPFVTRLVSHRTATIRKCFFFGWKILLIKKGCGFWWPYFLRGEVFGFLIVELVGLVEIAVIVFRV